MHLDHLAGTLVGPQARVAGAPGGPASQEERLSAGVREALGSDALAFGFPTVLSVTDPGVSRERDTRLCRSARRVSSRGTQRGLWGYGSLEPTGPAQGHVSCPRGVSLSLWSPRT